MTYIYTGGYELRVVLLTFEPTSQKCCEVISLYAYILLSIIISGYGTIKLRIVLNLQ